MEERRSIAHLLMGS